jgi:hypothetical protein
MPERSTVPGTVDPAVPALPPSGPPTRGWASRAGRWIRNFLILVVLVAAGLAALYAYVATSWSYSTGERAGYVQKFSNKGWVCKTWEGEIAMVALPGSMPEMFSFTVRDDKVAAEVNKSLGERVVLTYDYHLPLPSCFGETRYWITAVRRVGP